MSDAPRVSVVMPAYNAAVFLRQAVDSVLAQTWRDFELIVIDDGSTDETAAILSSYSDPRLRIIHQENRGLVGAINRGLAESRAPYIARMDADDICLSNRFTAQVEYLDAHSDIALLGGFVETMDEQGRTLAPVVAFPQSHEQILAALGRKPWVMCHPSVMFRREVVDEVGPYSLDFPVAEEVEFFARVMTKFRAATMDTVLLRYRLRRGSDSFVKKERGILHARMVAEMIDAWKPGQRFALSPEQRAKLNAQLEQLQKTKPRDDSAAAYQLRLGREYLRAARWREARHAYLSGILKNPLHWLGYAGLICGIIHKGAQHP